MARVEKTYSTTGLTLAGAVAVDLTNPAVVVVVSWTQTAAAANYSSGVTWAGAAMSLIQTRTIDSLGQRRVIEMWIKTAPATGSNSVVITRTGPGTTTPSVVMYALSDVDQGSPVGSSTSLEAPTLSGTQISFSLSSNLGDLVIAGMTPASLQTVPGTTVINSPSLGITAFGAGDPDNNGAALTLRSNVGAAPYVAAALVIAGAGGEPETVSIRDVRGGSVTSASSTITVTKPPLAENEDIALVFLFINDWTASITPPAGWTLNASLSSGSPTSNHYGAVYSREIDGTEGSTILFTLAVAARYSYSCVVYKTARRRLSLSGMTLVNVSSTTGVLGGIPSAVKSRYYNDRLFNFIGLRSTTTSAFSMTSNYNFYIPTNGNTINTASPYATGSAFAHRQLSGRDQDVGGLSKWSTTAGQKYGVVITGSISTKEPLRDSVFEGGALAPGLIGYTATPATFVKTFDNFEAGESPLDVYGLSISPDGLDVVTVGTIAPYIYAWSWQNGWGRKYASPVSLLGSVSQGVAFSPSGRHIAVATYSTPYIHAYVWQTDQEGGGFGTKLANPASLPTSLALDVAWAPTGAAVAVLTQSIPYIKAYQWVGNAFSSAYADPFPAILGAATRMTWSPDGAFVAIAGTFVPGIVVYRWTDVSGFGAIMGSPPFAMTNISSVSWSPDQSYISLGRNSGPPTTYTFPWDNTTGFGAAAITAPAVVGTSSRGGINWHPDGDVVAVAAPSPAPIQLFPFSGGAFGAIATAPRAFTTSSEMIKWGPAGNRTPVSAGSLFPLEAIKGLAALGLVPIESDVTSVAVSQTALARIESIRRILETAGLPIEWAVNLNFSDSVVGRERDLAFNSVLRRSP